jgi:MFS family permease
MTSVSREEGLGRYKYEVTKMTRVQLQAEAVRYYAESWKWRDRFYNAALALLLIGLVAGVLLVGWLVDRFGSLAPP